MVPGELSTVIPCFAASPLRGLICASNPGGSSIERPVGTSSLCSGFSNTALSRFAFRSRPAASWVAYSGSACLELLITLTSMSFHLFEVINFKLVDDEHKYQYQQIIKRKAHGTVIQFPEKKGYK